MSFLSRQEIIDLASRYVDSGEIVDFPIDGDLFCLIGRDLPEGKPLAEEEGWSFQGYGICRGYSIDTEEKPSGKWLWMNFASLAAFPPAQQALKLKPPHVVKGRFQNAGRTSEIRIIKISLHESSGPTTTDSRPFRKTKSAQPSNDQDISGKIVQFRPKKKA
jgi:hypothetical protein